MISGRQRRILLALSSKQFVTSEWIAKELNLSSRTVRDEIHRMNTISPTSFKITSVRGKGYQLQEYEPAYLNKLSQNTETIMSYDFSVQKNRITYLLKKLLLADGYLKLDVLADEMYVSKSTIQNDLKKVRAILLQEKLQLLNRPYYGMAVNGKEYDKRLCLSKYVYQDTQPFDQLNRHWQFDRESFKKIKEIILTQAEFYHVAFSDVALENLAVHIAIACERIKQGKLIDVLPGHLSGKYSFERKLASEIIKHIETYTCLVFPYTELEYVVVQLLGTKLIYGDDIFNKSEFKEAQHLVQVIIEKLHLKFGWDFSNNKDFKQALTLHLRTTLNRLRYGMSIRNPLKSEIKQKYWAAFEGAVIAGQCVKEVTGVVVNEDEAAYIAIHIESVLQQQVKGHEEFKKRILVVCTSGLGSAKLISIKLERLLGSSLEIISTISYYQLLKQDLTKIDLIISTIPLEEQLPVPVYVLDEFLNEQDVYAIKKLVLTATGIKDTFLDSKHIFIQQKFSNKREVLHFLSNQLISQHLVEKDYENLLLQRESFASTYFGNLTAIPHPVHMVTKKTFWTICTLERPLTWDKAGHQVQFICLMNIKKGEKNNLEQMYQRLLAFLEDKELVRKVVKANTKSEVIKLLGE
ncbi:BglG family transcription antiterminator [Liquorilactobacillus capillatus]|uniref:Uncharacterized protein n=1 Tax=Liquorilactobacillus capillatus DSM 19910 TaxID=1423731 RepID=A0A0R1MGL0_9LACO|nr:BglG family transcription antiterminator [Liquorilactobacillus capillatus]KRL03531.1 hypothetical protein FC81_GL001785 [Liquorilactobacillus capillatus DSM 19910]